MKELMMKDIQGDEYIRLRSYIRAHIKPKRHKPYHSSLCSVWSVQSIIKRIEKMLKENVNRKEQRKRVLFWKDHLRLLKELS